MKRILFTLMALFLTTAMYSQYYYIPYTHEGKNPGDVNKEGENPYPAQAAGWNVIWNGGSASAVGYSPLQTVPFSFKFNGADVQKYKVSNAGFLTFSTGATKNLATFGNETLPSASVPDSSVCVLGIKPIQSVSGTTTYKSAILTKTFGTAPHRQQWIQFNYFGEANINQGWTYWSIVLEEGTNNIYIVDMKTLCVSSGMLCSNNVKLSAGIQIDSANAETIDGSPNLGALQITENIFTSEDNSFYKFVQQARPAHDMIARSIDMKDILVLKDAPFTISGTFINAGTDAVNNFDFAYQINSETPVTGNVAVSIAKNEEGKATHPIKWTPTAVGKYTITIWPASINGSPDEVNDNDKVSFTVSVVNRVAERTLLNEIFTSSTCPPCRPGNENTDQNIFPYREGKFTVIKYQQDFPGNGDPYATKETVSRRGFYGVNAIPNMQVDGGWNGNAQIYTLELFDEFQAKPSFIELKATHTFNWRTIKVDVDITPLSDFNNPNLRLFVAVNEKRTEKNVQTNGETEFFHVMKKMIPNETGTAIGNLSSEVTKTISNLSFTFPGGYRLPINGRTSNQIKLTTENSVEDFRNLEVVVFVQDVVTKEVYQSAYSTGTFLGIDENEENASAFKLSPNPVNNIGNVSFELDNASQVSFDVYNTLGQKMQHVADGNYLKGAHTVNFDASALVSGIYFMNITTNNGTVTKRFSVVK